VSAKATSRCLAETGSCRNVERQTELVFGRLEVALGAAECAAMHTVHFNASVALEW
jgi:hypothetical protein